MRVEHPELSVESDAGPGAPFVAIAFAGLAVTLDGSGAAYLAEHGALIVSDLHLEKGSNAAARGRLLPGARQP